MLFIGNEIVVTMSKRRKTTDTVRWAYVTARVTSKHEFRFDKLDDTEVTLAKAGFKLDDDREEALCQDGDEHDVTRYYVGLPKITKGGDDWVDRARRTAYGVFEKHHVALNTLSLVMRNGPSVSVVSWSCLR